MATARSIANDLGSPGYVVPGFQNGIMTVAGITTDTTAGTATQTLSGWADYVVGAVSSAAAGTTLNVTKTGAGLLTFSGDNSGWTSTTQGTLTLSGGTTRLFGANPIGAATITMNGGLLELRNDVSTNVATNIAGVSAASTIDLDHTIGGSGSGATITLGTILGSLGTASQTLNIVGDRGYSLTTGAVTTNSTFTLTLANDLSAPGYGAAGYTPGLITLGSVTNASGTAGALVLGGVGDYAPFNGNISNTGGGTLNITKTALGITTFDGNNNAWTGGTLTAGGGTTFIDATNTNAVGSANLAITAGLLEILSATGTNGSPWSTKNLGVGAGTFDVDPLAGSCAAAQSVNLGGLTVAEQTLFIDSNHGYSVTFNAVGTQGATTTTLTNVGNGTVNLAGGLTSTATTATWTLNGTGDFTVAGPITNGSGTVALTKTGYGLVTLGGANTIGGTVIDNSGVLRITNAGALAGAGTLTFNGGNNNANGVASLDLRSDTGMDLSSRGFTTNAFNFLINVDRAIGGTGTNQTMIVGGGSIADAGGLGRDSPWRPRLFTPVWIGHQHDRIHGNHQHYRPGRLTISSRVSPAPAGLSSTAGSPIPAPPQPARSPWPARVIISSRGR